MFYKSDMVTKAIVPDLAALVWSACQVSSPDEVVLVWAAFQVSSIHAIRQDGSDDEKMIC
jgi:hypothetical protein